MSLAIKAKITAFSPQTTCLRGSVLYITTYACMYRCDIKNIILILWLISEEFLDSDISNEEIQTSLSQHLMWKEKKRCSQVGVTKGISGIRQINYQLLKYNNSTQRAPHPANGKKVQVYANALAYANLWYKFKHFFFSVVLLLLLDKSNFHSYKNLITFISKGVIEFWCSPCERHLYNLAGNQKAFDNLRNQTVLHGLIVLICCWNFLKVVVSSFPLLFLQSQKPPRRTLVVFFHPVSYTFSLIVEPLLLQPWITPFLPFWLWMLEMIPLPAYTDKVREPIWCCLLRKHD